jgi:hypothetical protein
MPNSTIENLNSSPAISEVGEIQKLEKEKLFFAALPRSGSTFIGSLMARHAEGTFHMGESFLWGDDTAQCSCGEISCDIISGLRQAILSSLHKNGILEIGKNLGYLDVYLEPKKQRHTKSLGGDLDPSKVTTEVVNEKLKAAAAALDSLADIYIEHLGVERVVDNSKYADLGLALLENHDWKVIGIARSPFALAWSNKKVEQRKGVKRPLVDKLEVYKHHMKILQELKKRGARIVNYEAFARETEKYINMMVGDFSEATKIEMVDQQQTNQVDHTLGGNRWLFENEGKLPEVRLDEDWKTSLSLEDMELIIADAELVQLYRDCGYDLVKDYEEVKRIRAFSDVLSFDEKKTFIKEGKVIKKSSETEIAQIENATKYLESRPITLEGDISVKVVPFEVEGGNYLVMPLAGINLEVLLRSNYEQNKQKLLPIIKELLHKMKATGFLWGEIAPRNMIWSESENTLFLVDFERPTELLDRAVSDTEMSDFLRKYALEEVSAQFLAEDSKNIFDGLITDTENKGSVNIDEISSKRRKMLAKLLFPDMPSISYQELNKVNDLIALLSRPFEVNGSIYYPIEKLDEVSSKYGPEMYVEVLKELSKLYTPAEEVDYQRIYNFLEKLITPKSENFDVIDLNGRRLLASAELNLEIELKNFTPRSGLIINEILINNSEIVQGKKVLDLGTGEPGTIAQVAHVLGGRVTGVDIDESAIDHARLSSLQASDIEFLQSDLFGAFAW